MRFSHLIKITTVIFIIFLNTCMQVFAHGLSTTILVYETEKYRIEFETEPEYPVVYKEVHLDLSIFDKALGKPLQNTQIQLDLQTIFPEKKETDDYVIIYRSIPQNVLSGQEVELLFIVIDRFSLLPLPEQEVVLSIGDQSFRPSLKDGAQYYFTYIPQNEGIYELYLTVNGKRLTFGDQWWEDEFEMLVGSETEKVSQFTLFMAEEKNEEGDVDYMEGVEHSKSQYYAKHRFQEGGVYEVSLIINDETIPLDFKLTIDKFDYEDYIKIVVLVFIVFWVGYRTFWAYRRYKTLKSVPNKTKSQ